MSVAFAASPTILNRDYSNMSGSDILSPETRSELLVHSGFSCPQRRMPDFWSSLKRKFAIMLECEVRYQGDTLMAFSRMGPLIPTKTLKQLRDKRAETN
ncbi:hypothetical protein JTB14_032412 [Gonioctena quinquepunctata]|nr:hypothetical protein JTB14_032412 [Gonioctena quinquepunctata]